MDSRASLAGFQAGMAIEGLGGWGAGELKCRETGILLGGAGLSQKTPVTICSGSGKAYALKAEPGFRRWVSFLFFAPMLTDPRLNHQAMPIGVCVRPGSSDQGQRPDPG